MEDDQKILEEEQKRLLRRYTRMQKKDRRPQGEQIHKMKTKYDRQKSKRSWVESIEEEEDYE